MQNEPKNCFGFTLIEIMVVLSIIVVLAILILSGYSEGRPRQATERTAEAFIGDLYRARNRGFLEFPHPFDGDSSDLRVGGYGIKINRVTDENSYTYFFRDSSNNESIIEVIEIEDLSYISSLSVNGSGVSSVEIFFGKENVKINDSETHAARVVFSSRSGEVKRAVDINNKGVAKIIYDI